jgi:lipopolysaccharide biosynthesis protein
MAIVAHIHYEDVWPELCAQIKAAFPLGCDLFISITSSKFAALIRRDFPKAYLIHVENRGRDILPFLKILKNILSLKYLAVCKIHTKKSTYREDGKKLRESLFQSNLGSASNISNIEQMFTKDETLGLACPENFLLPHTDQNMTFNNTKVSYIAGLLDVKFKYTIFPAGSMFWFRPEALAKLIELEDSLFPMEEGLADGTTAHAVERLFASLAESAGYIIEKLPDSHPKEKIPHPINFWQSVPKFHAEHSAY